MWIGLRSPDTAAYLRPMFSGTRTCATRADRRRDASEGARLLLALPSVEGLLSRAGRCCGRTRRARLPTRASASRSSCRPAVCGRRSAARTVNGDRLVGAHRPRTVIEFATCTRPDEREREGLLGHQRHRQREREHVQVGRRQDVRNTESADPLVGGQVRRSRSSVRPAHRPSRAACRRDAAVRSRPRGRTAAAARAAVPGSSSSCADEVLAAHPQHLAVDAAGAG